MNRDRVLNTDEQVSDSERAEGAKKTYVTPEVTTLGDARTHTRGPTVGHRIDFGRPRRY